MTSLRQYMGELLRYAWLTVKKYPRESFCAAFVIVGVYSLPVLANAVFLSLAGFHGIDWNPVDFGYEWMDIQQDSTLRLYWLVALAAPLAVIAVIVALVVRDRQRHLFGNAHWASWLEAKKAGLMAEKGILLARKWGRYLKVGGYEHVFVFWPSGSGKTNALAIPNLLNWHGSCIVNDVKLTLFEKTAGFRASCGQKCFVWNPAATDGRTHCYNPLDSVSRDKSKRIDGLQKIANIFIPDSQTQREPIWTAIPRSLFVALALYLMDTPALPCTIGEIVRLLKNNPNFKDYLWEIIKERDDLDAVTYRNLVSFLQTEPKLQANLLQSFLSYFELFDVPMIDASTSRSDFDIRNLRREPMTIYVGVTTGNIRRLSPLLTVFYEQVMDGMLESVPNEKEEPYDLLLLMDEFSALRRMEIMRSTVGLMREYRVRLMAIIQDLPQLYETYGVNGAKSFINNRIRLVAAQNDLDSARLISGWLGDKTVAQRSQNRRGISWEAQVAADSESLSYTRRPLLSPDEIMRLPRDEMIVVCEGSAPIRAKKNFWQADVRLKERAVGKMNIPRIEPTMVTFDRLSFETKSNAAVGKGSGNEKSDDLMDDK